MKSPLSGLCCFSPSKEDTNNEEVEIAPPNAAANEVVDAQPNPSDEVVAPAPDVVTSHSQGDVVSDQSEGEVVTSQPQGGMAASLAEGMKGHKRTPSEVSSPAVVTATARTPPPKASRTSSSSASYKSTSSVVTAIMVTARPGMRKDESKESVVTAIERTTMEGVSGESSPSKSGMDSQVSKVDEVDGSQESKASLKSPESKSGAASPASPASPASKTVKEGSAEPMASAASPAKSEAKSESSEEEDIPDDVTPLEEVNKLNEIIDSDKFDLKHPFWDKVSLFYGDITKIKVDAIVNAANAPLSGGGGVDGAIHSAAGYNQLQAECRKHERPVATGQAVVTGACKLSAYVKKIIHCVGPICHGRVTKERRQKLISCYRRAIELSEENGLRSIAFCCISTGIYGYDNRDAARHVIKFLYKYFSKAENVEKWDRVVLCLFMDIDKQCYKHFILQLLKNPALFDEDEEDSEEEEDDEKKKKKEKKEEDEKDEKDDGEKDEKMDEDKEEKKDEKKEKKEDEQKEGETTDEKEDKTEENKKDKKDEDGKDETDHKDSPKIDDKENKKDDTVSETESKLDKSTVVGEESRKEETVPSASDTNTVEKTIDEEQEGGKSEGEKENSVIDDNEKEDVMSGKKRAPCDENEDQPPIKRDKIERESAV